MAGSLEGVLARIPGLGGYLGGQEQDRVAQAAAQQGQLGQLQQMGALQGILAKAQAAKQQEAYRGALQALGPNPTQEGLAGVAAQFGTPDKLLDTQQRSLDRQSTQRVEAAKLIQAHQFKLDEIKQRSTDTAALARETLAEKQRFERSMKEFMVANRPPRAEPAPRNLQLTTDAAGNQLIVNPDGTTRPLTTSDGKGVQKPVAADRPMTEFQGKAALYGTRSAQSDKVLKALEDKISTAGLAAGQATGVIGNALMSSEQQRVSQAQRDFVNAVLRQESGAVISDAEFANAKQQYFPAPGDTPQVVSQKRANRQLAIQGFARMSGPKGASDIKAIIDEPLLPGAPATNPTPQQAGGAITPSAKRIASDAEYDALPSGSMFVGPDGKTRKKP